MRRRLDLLAGLADHALQARLARLAGARARAREIEARLDRLGRGMRREAGRVEFSDAAELLASARWRGWAEGRRAETRAQFDRAAEAAENARRLAALGFGRLRAIETLAERAEREALAEERRRAEREGRPPDR